MKGVHPDRRLTRALMQEEAEEGGDDGEEEDSEAAGGVAAAAQAAAPCGPGSSPACVQKRPGRMQTRPTFSLEDNQEGPGGGSSSRRRKRRLQQSSADALTTRLSAQTLWEEGFKGKGVKVGVFDTGIKGDHPHVKNIK